MDAISALVGRVSCGQLVAPAPTSEQRQGMYRAALRAADHGMLRPWRCLEIEGEALAQFGEVLLAAAVAETPEMEEAERRRVLQMPLRAPLVVVAIASYKEHPKVPQWEQMITAGAAVQNLITAAFALGVGAYWRTGPLTNHAQVRQALSVEEHEFIVGFIYLGTPAIAAKPVPDLNIDDFFAPWPSK